MNLKKNKYKIATILPYKESYSLESASAASLWVSEYYHKSKFKKNNLIYGNTISKNFLTQNYVNLKLKNIRNRLRSTSKEYIKKLTKEIINKSFDIVEIHNRPLILKELMTKINSKWIFYYHNDPLSMSGSKLISERIEILKKADKIVFISSWIKKKFFTDLDGFSDEKTEIIYPGVIKRRYVKKNKFITFVGKLNFAKGYDLYKDAILKILDEYPDWKAFSIGDESRRKIFINHKHHYELGFLNHKETLKMLDKSDLAIVPSRWEEPFGRVSLEAAVSSCATIISNRGGLPETNDHAVILKKNDSLNIYREIKKLITNNKKKKIIQNLSRKNVKHLIFKNTKKIDEIRIKVLEDKMIMAKTKLKILHITNFNDRFDGRLHYNTGKRLNNGFIRNGHNVLSISDRDLTHNNRSIFDVKGVNYFNDKIFNNFINFKPDLIVMGHADKVLKETLLKIKKIKNVKLCQWFLDPVNKFGPDYSKNKKRILELDKVIDCTFITTSPDAINYKIHNSFFMPNPTDMSFEILNNAQKKNKKDLFFAMSHGVHRGTLKKGKFDNREVVLKKLEKILTTITYDFFGYKNKQPIWSDNFLEILKNYDMGLNLSRGKPIKYYSSDRLVQIIGNGLLCFIDERTKLQKLIPKSYAVYYKDIPDLIKKILFYKKNTKLLKKIALKGKKFYNSNYNSSIVSQYIIDKTLGFKHKYNYFWINK